MPNDYYDMVQEDSENNPQSDTYDKVDMSSKEDHNYSSCNPSQ